MKTPANAIVDFRNTPLGIKDGRQQRRDPGIPVDTPRSVSSDPGAGGQEYTWRPHADDPVITFSPSFGCHCPRALKVLPTATVVRLVAGYMAWRALPVPT